MKVKVINLRYDEVYKNALLVIKQKLTNLDFVDTCKKDYDTHA